MASTQASPVVPAVSDERIDRLRRFNLIMALVHLASGLVMWLSSNDFELQVSSFTLNGPPGTPLADGELFEALSFPLGFWTAMFLFLSAVAHLFVATIGFDLYRSELRAGRNRIRWVEYSLSATLMVVLIEAGAMASKLHIPMDAMIGILARPDGIMRPLEHRMRDRMCHGDYAGGMSVTNARNDSTLALETAQDFGVPLFATLAAHTPYEIADQLGYGDLDYAALAKLWESWCDVKFS